MLLLRSGTSISRVRRASSFVVIASIAIVAGCASNAEPPVVAIAEPGEHARTDGTRSGKSESERPSTGFKLLEGQLASLGQEFDSACGADTDKKVCGTRGRVSVETSNHPLHAQAPCELESLTKDGSVSPFASAACVVGDEIVATSACVMCRLPDAGWSFHGRISEMTDDQAEEVFRQLRLQGSVPDDADGWREAIALGEAPRERGDAVPVPQPMH